MQPTGITYEEGTNWGCGSTKRNAKGSQVNNIELFFSYGLQKKSILNFSVPVLPSQCNTLAEVENSTLSGAFLQKY